MKWNDWRLTTTVEKLCSPTTPATIPPTIWLIHKFIYTHEMAKRERRGRLVFHSTRRSIDSMELASERGGWVSEKISDVSNEWDCKLELKGARVWHLCESQSRWWTAPHTTHDIRISPILARVSESSTRRTETSATHSSFIVSHSSSGIIQQRQQQRRRQGVKRILTQRKTQKAGNQCNGRLWPTPTAHHSRLSHSLSSIHPSRAVVQLSRCSNVYSRFQWVFFHFHCPSSPRLHTTAR